jgi:hypothetical protein
MPGPQNEEGWPRLGVVHALDVLLLVEGVEHGVFPFD